MKSNNIDCISLTPMLTMQGQGVVKGIAIGKALVMGAAALEVPHYYIAHADIDSECERLVSAINTASLELEEMVQSLPIDAPKELGPLLNVHKLLLNDPVLLQESCNLIVKNRYNAEWALATQGQILAQQFAAMSNEYMRERGADIRQVIERVLVVLSGIQGEIADVSNSNSQEPYIVVARDISPADMLKLRDGNFQAFLTDLGGPTSHTAILARSMNVPAVVGLGSFQSLVNDQDTIIVDGFTGAVFVNPSPQTLQEYKKRQQQHKLEREQLRLLRDAPSITIDGIQTEILANIELPQEAELAMQSGADGIGLFRTEFLFIGKSYLPSEEEQYQAYTKVVKTMTGKPVTIRTLDLGADKALDDDATVATNPALGLRAVRYCLAQPELFSTQLRALLRASQHGHIKILIPMVTCMEEINAVRHCINTAWQQLRIVNPDIKINISLGAMIETPAIAIAPEPFAQELDFLSIGTNDLIQYTLAVDRGDPDVAQMYDPMHPAVLRLISNVINVGERFNVPVSMCGEMAGESSVTRLLLGLGLKSFSMHPQQILDVKKQIISAHSTALRFALASALNRAQRVDSKIFTGEL